MYMTPTRPPQPDIARDVLRVITACSLVTEHANANGIPLAQAELLDAVCKQLHACADYRQEEVVTRTIEKTLQQVAALPVRAAGNRGFVRWTGREYVATAPEEHQSRLRTSIQSEAWTRTEAIRRLVGEAYTAVPTTEQALEQLLASYRESGVDSEHVCWAVITAEAHEHIQLIWHCIHKLRRAYPETPGAEMLGYGWRGLLLALRHFDPALGYKFSTYAATRISGTIRDGLRSELPVSKRLLTYQRKVLSAQEELACNLSRPPSLAELATKLEEDIERLRTLLPRLGEPCPLEYVTDSYSSKSGTQSFASTVLVSRDDPEEEATQAVLRGTVEDALRDLPPAQAAAVRVLILGGDPAEVAGVPTRQLRIDKERALATLRANSHLQSWAAFC